MLLTRFRLKGLLNILDPRRLLLELSDTVRSRWLSKEPFLVLGMKKLRRPETGVGSALVKKFVTCP